MNDKCKHGIELSTVCKDCDDEQADLIITKGLTMPPSKTPRTDKEQISVTTALMRYGERKRVVPAEVVKAIELELTEANNKLAKISRMVEIAETVNDANSEMAVASSASFHEALSYTMLDEVEKERDQLRKALSEALKNYNELLYASTEAKLT